jgi:hypothetical protein
MHSFDTRTASHASIAPLRTRTDVSFPPRPIRTLHISIARRRRCSVSPLLRRRITVICSPAPTATIIFTAQVTLFPSPFFSLLLLLSTLSLIQVFACVGADSTCDCPSDHSQGAFAYELTAQESACGTAQQSWAEIFNVALWLAWVVCYRMTTIPTPTTAWCWAAVVAHFVVVIRIHVVFVVSASFVDRFMASVRPRCRWWWWH